MKKNFIKNNKTPFIIFCCGLIISIIIMVLVKNTITAQRQLQFENQSEQITALIEDRMNIYTNVLYGAQGLFNASQEVESDEWLHYVEKLDLATHYAGISILSYAEKVPQNATTSFPYDIYPQSTKDFYVAYKYIQPLTPDRIKILGFDLSSEKNRNDTMVKAGQTDKPTATPLIISIATGVPSFTIFAPVYKASTTPEFDNIQGFVLAGFRTKELFDGISSNPIFDKNINLKIYDASNADAVASSTLLYDKDTGVYEKETFISRFHKQKTITVGQRTWRLIYTELPDYNVNTFNAFLPVLILLAGILLSGLLAWLLYSYASSRDRATLLAETITRSLKESEEKYRAIFDSLQDVFYRTDLKGTITIVSPSIERYTGVPAEKLIGKNALDFYPDKSAREKMLGELQKKGFVSDYPIVLSGRDSNSIDVSVNARVLFDEKKNPVGVEGVLRDVTERRRAENELKANRDELERLNALMIGRELKMVELKKELEKKDKR